MRKRRMFFVNGRMVYAYTFTTDDKDQCKEAYSYILNMLGKLPEDIKERLEVVA